MGILGLITNGTPSLSKKACFRLVGARTDMDLGMRGFRPLKLGFELRGLGSMGPLWAPKTTTNDPKPYRV